MRLTASEINQAIADTCRTLDVPAFASQIRWNWNTRYSAKMGTARYKDNSLQLSTQVYSVASTEDQIRNVVHEVCHLVAGHLFGLRIKAHGWEWASLMRKCGRKPERCHSNVVAVHTGICACAAGVPLTQIIYGKIKRGTRSYRCRKCRQQIKLNSF